VFYAVPDELLGVSEATVAVDALGEDYARSSLIECLEDRTFTHSQQAGNLHRTEVHTCLRDDVRYGPAREDERSIQAGINESALDASREVLFRRTLYADRLRRTL
jgi:hypothetical protein